MVEEEKTLEEYIQEAEASRPQVGCARVIIPCLVGICIGLIAVVA